MPAPDALRPVSRTISATVLAIAIAAGTLSAVAGTAAAAPISKQQKAAQLQDEIDATDVQISALAESLLSAEARRDIAQAEVVEAEGRIQQAQIDVARIRALVEENLASLYRRSVAGSSGNDFDFDNTNELLRRGQYSKAQASNDDQLLEQLAAAQEDLAIRREDAQRARDSAAAETDQISSVKAQFEATRVAQQALLDKVKGEIAAAIAAERARRAAEARAKFSRPPVNAPNVGPPNGSASQAIAFARGVVGSPYSTNPREGPSYDCSGLTKSAWRAAGVSIPNTSGAQYSALPHVSLDAVQAGDLIFWGAGGSSHVALYVGGGMIIDASGSANQVMERSIWGSPVGAARVV